MEDDTFRALIEQAHQLEELTKHPGWPILVDGLEARMRGDKITVLNNRVTDLEHYRKIAGRLVGIHEAIDFPKTVQQMVETERERRGENRDDAA